MRHASVILLCLVVAFFRNEGRYIVFFWMLLLILRFKKARKWMSTALLVTMAAVILVNNVLMPYYNITPGSVREMMSIPFQQTARYVSVSPEDITEEERAAIDKLLGYDTLESRYNADLSDPVKDEYNENADREDWIRYFRAWFEMLKRHPLIYVDAAICNYYYYFYPGGRIASNYSYEWARYCMHAVNSMTESVGMDLHFPQSLASLRTAYEELREGLLHLPIVGVLGCAAVYVWILLFFAVFLLWRKKIDVLLVSVVPLLGSLGVSLLGPCNGDYFRYAYIFTIVLPAVALLSLYKGSHT